MMVWRHLHAPAALSRSTSICNKLIVPLKRQRVPGIAAGYCTNV